jgi:hypothetical protein
LSTFPYSFLLNPYAFIFPIIAVLLHVLTQILIIAVTVIFRFLILALFTLLIPLLCSDSVSHFILAPPNIHVSVYTHYFSPVSCQFLTFLHVFPCSIPCP